ncbi:MAG: hypothetical protein HDR88_10230 [Bacteroides sp.]|nr:hypothetical protein [Bacteroides sp.]
MKNFNHIPNNLTAEQYAELDRIADRIIGEGEDTGASESRIRAAIAEAQKRYIKRIS